MHSSEVPFICRATKLTNGQIPSNVSTDGKVSFGGTAGRIDATTWWIVAACWALNLDYSLEDYLLPKIKKAMAVTKAWEYNQKGFVYTPLGGNWADEYISSGYTLYDQALRYWGMRSLGSVIQDTQILEEANELRQNIIHNFSFSHKPDGSEYHPVAYKEAYKKMDFWPSTFSPAGYDSRWDLAANALALLVGLNNNVNELANYVNQFFEMNSSQMLPVFFPIIQPEDDEWKLLSHNYSYSFKNYPYQFHNGGSWPVFNGLLALAFTLNGRDDISKNILASHHDNFTGNDASKMFSEYWDVRSGEPKGVSQLCFSAAGYIMMNTTPKEIRDVKNKILC
ncbi:MAG: glycoside hydrolase 100 family protein [Flavobacteriales bacterium]